ncbi:signal peptidase I [Rothia sp. P5766]|uniref:signal peptidase I n=1 Tax=unclassified Rothia (in: high G+C Gram-positive bacteria) TaxID=2689056 RepID=UPI003AD04034
MDSGLTAESSEARRQPFLRGWRLVATASLLALAVLLVIRSFFYDVYYIPSASMEPTYEPGDRLIVSKQSGHIERGSVVVFDGTGSFSPYQSGSPWVRDPLGTAGQWLGLVGSDTVYIKRVIGVGGDTVECCDSEGYLLVNGQRLEEPYLPQGESASDVSFSVQVPEGRIWLMGDNRSNSADSRALLGAPGGGMVRVDKVIGSPVYTVWPLNKIGPSSTTPD